MGQVTETVDRLARLVAAGQVVVLSGAGLSTESGIPDYRGPSGVARRHTPMTWQTFVGDPLARRRYWARSHLGWRMIARAAPNAGHRAIAGLQAGGLVTGVITQNVDGLHDAAGSEGVVELHGRLDRVVCLDCGNLVGREELDLRLRQANPGFDARVAAVNPDGDVDVADADVAGFHVVDCTVCGGGMLKPDVVFFGESVPAERVRRCFALVERARSLLVVGSSLSVLSGRRFVVRAARSGIPVAIVNQGPTRGDDHAEVIVDGPLGEVLPEVLRRCGRGPTQDRRAQGAPAEALVPGGVSPAPPPRRPHRHAAA